MPRSSRKSTSSTTTSASSSTPSTPPTLTSLQHRWQSFEQYVQTPAATTNIVDTLRTYSDLFKDVQAMEQYANQHHQQWMALLDTPASIQRTPTDPQPNLSEWVTQYNEMAHQLELLLQSSSTAIADPKHRQTLLDQYQTLSEGMARIEQHLNDSEKNTVPTCTVDA